MKLFKFIFKTCIPLKSIIFGLLICTFLMALDTNLRPYLIKLIINQNNFSWSSYSLLGVLYLLSQITHVIATSSRDWLGTKFHTNYRAMIAHKYLDDLSRYPYSFFQETMSGIITSKITDAFNSIPVIVFIGFEKFINFILVVLIALIMLANISYIFVIASLILVVTFLSISYYFYLKYDPINREYAKCRPRIFGYLADYFTNILSVWNFAKIKEEKKKFKELTDDWFNQSTKAGRYLCRFYLTHGLLVALYMAFLVIFLGYLRSNNLITLGDYALVFMVNFKITDMLFDISTASRDFVITCGVAGNAIELLDRKMEVVDKDGATELNQAGGDIIFDSVSFGYQSSTLLFDNLTITIPRGQKVGLVGYSGSGKTSFVNLLMRLYEINSGAISIGSDDIRQVTYESLRGHISIIPQEPNLFNRTLFENIAYGKEEIDKEQVIQAAKMAKCHEFISKLSDGYDTLVGERGIKLSGGQRQRIAIARAILKAAPILILDEATSALDSLTENDIQEAILPLIEKSTTIAVAHRLSTLNNMDRILVFDNGKIVEDGTHEELIDRDGLYKSMWGAQKGGFLPDKKL